MAEGEEETFPIVRVEGGVDMWFTWETSSDPFFNRGNLYCWAFKLGQIRRQHIHTPSEKEVCLLKLVRELYDQKIGHLASRWNDACGSGLKDRPIEYEHAKIKLGDVFDNYTTSDGVLQVPKWVNFKYAVEEYLENDPRIKFHPSRVHQFVEERGVEQLEEMA
jgi:hypothetical protein